MYKRQGVDRPHKGGVRTVLDDAVVVGHHDGVDVLDPRDGSVQVVGEVGDVLFVLFLDAMSSNA